MIAPYRAEFVDSGAQLEGGRLVRSAHPTTAKSQPGGRGISIAPYDSHGGSLSREYDEKAGARCAPYI